MTPTLAASPLHPARDCMAPDTEPTDAELAEVMREAAEVARTRKRHGDAWLAAEMARAFDAVGLADAAALARTSR
jgi:hypothetical protein